MQDYKPKSFWQKPEGVTGAVFLVGIAGLIGYLAVSGIFAEIMASVLTMTIAGVVLAAILYIFLDPKTRTLVSYMYKSVMRWITGLFVQIDPIGILKSYIDDLEDNISKMNKQINMLKKQMHQLNETIHNNKKEISENLQLASKAKEKDIKKQVILRSRKAGRLKESNIKLEDLYKKMEVLYRVLNKMFENSQILVEDVKDQVKVKEQERKAMRASHSAMKSAMNIISGNKDQRYMFDMALEAIADDVNQKVGEMERFMEMSSSFMDSVDLQNGVFEEEGMAMLEKWEKEGVSKILGEEKQSLLMQANDENEVLDLNQPVKVAVREEGHQNQYDTMFD